MMHKGTITFLFDSLEFFDESWDSGPDEALRLLNRIAHARAGLLPKNVRIVKLAERPDAAHAIAGERR